RRGSRRRIDIGASLRPATREVSPRRLGGPEVLYGPPVDPPDDVTKGQAALTSWWSRTTPTPCGSRWSGGTRAAGCWASPGPPSPTPPAWSLPPRSPARQLPLPPTPSPRPGGPVQRRTDRAAHPPLAGRAMPALHPTGPGRHPATPDDFLAALRQSRLLTPEQLRESEGLLRGRRDPRRLAKALVK